MFLLIINSVQRTKRGENYFLVPRKSITNFLYPLLLVISVADPDPSDPQVFGPPGSGLLVRGTDPDPSIIKQK